MARKMKAADTLLNFSEFGLRKIENSFLKYWDEICLIVSWHVLVIFLPLSVKSKDSFCISSSLRLPSQPCEDRTFSAGGV